MSEDDIIYWQDVLDAVRANRLENLKCPFCYEGAVSVTRTELKTRVECTRCRHFVEGRFPEDG